MGHTNLQINKDIVAPPRKMIAYTIFIIALWLINPEIRRLYDWRFGFADVEFISLLSLVSLLPYVYLFFSERLWHKIPRIFMLLAWLWLGVFTYGLILAIFNKNILPASYSYLQFVLPLAPAVWLASLKISLREKLLNALFIFTTILSIYGIIQWIFVPEWDAYWLNTVGTMGILSYGRATPFAIRVFSTMNAPGVFGNYLALLLLLAMPKLSLRRPILLVQYVIWLITFGLTLDRTGWLMTLIGAFIYCLLCGRIRIFFTIMLIAVSFGFALEWFASDTPIAQILTTRINTFSDLQNDISYRERHALYDDLIAHLPEAPLGQGLGIFGVGTKLSDASLSQIDSGILSHILELGFAGFFVVVGTLLGGVLYALRIGFSAKRKHREDIYEYAIVVAALQFALLLAESSGDIHNGALAIIMWISLALVAQEDSLLNTTENVSITHHHNSWQLVPADYSSTKPS